MNDQKSKRGFSRRDWFKTAAAGAGLMVVRPARSAAAPVSLHPAEHWGPEKEMK